MTNDQGSDKPPAKTEDQATSESPMVQPAPQQNEIRKESNESTGSKQDETQELAREFRTVEIIQIGISGALGIIGIIALFIYYGQLKQMRKATEKAGISADAAKTAADTAKQSFRLTERAWLAVAAANNVMQDGKPIYVPVRIMNNGRTPAKKVNGA